MSVKFQITLPDDLAMELKAAAARQKMPLARFTRETMEARLRESRSKRGAHPFAAICGIVDAPETDLAARVDEILYR